MSTVETVAAVFRGVEPSLVTERVRVPPAKANEVRLRVVACGACLSDVHKLRGHGLVPAPNVFGHEIAGVVTDVGADVRRISVGDRVVCTFLVPCGDCEACRRGDEDECGPFRVRMQREGVRFDGSPRLETADGTPLRTSGVGGLAGAITLPETAVYALPSSWPERIPLADAAVLGCAGLTAYGAVRTAEVGTGSKVVVLGGGGVGLGVIALARHAGASAVVATDMKEPAREAARAFGATAAIAADAADLREQIVTALGGEPGIVIDTIGVQATVRQALALAAVGGRIVVTGLGGTGGIEIEDLTVFVRRKLTLIGSYAAVPSRDMPSLLAAVADGAFDPSALISARYPFERARDAYADLAAGSITGRALIEGVTRAGERL